MTVTAFDSEADEQQQIRAAGSSMVKVKVGNEYYDAVTAHRCRVCQSPHRMFIEGEILKGSGYKAIADHIQNWPTGLLDHPNSASMQYHMAEGHAPIKTVQHRAVMEALAEDAGIEIANGVKSLADKVVLAHAVIDRAHERLVNRDIEPSLQDAAAAMRFLADYEAKHSKEGLTEEMWRDAMYAYMEVLAPEVSPERRDAVSRALENHPMLRALKEFQERQALESGDVVEGHVEG
jgi:hypothetical protein